MAILNDLDIRLSTKPNRKHSRVRLNGSIFVAFLTELVPARLALLVLPVKRGLHRGFVRLRLTPPRGSPRGTAGGVHCMAGSLTRDSGLVFIARTGMAVLQVRLGSGSGSDTYLHG